jgi:hypothetical protein
VVGESAKRDVLKHLAKGRPVTPLPKAKVKIGSVVVHTRFRSNSKSGGSIWSFNINPNTLTADFELWICGSSAAYYLIPKATVEKIYNDPAGYTDYTHGEIRVADINFQTHRCTYGKGRSADFTAYFKANL